MLTPKEAEVGVQLQGTGYKATVVVSRFNCRLFVQRYELLQQSSQNDGEAAGLEAFFQDLKQLAEEKGVTKIVSKIRASQAAASWPRLEALGIVREAFVPRFFADGEDAWVLCCFVDDTRKERKPWVKEQEDLNLKQTLQPAGKRPFTTAKLPEGYTTEFLSTAATAKELGQFYAKVFSAYPYPIDDPKFLLDSATLDPKSLTMSIHRVVRNQEGAIVAAVGGDVDMKEMNAEVTDFATLPSERGKGLASFLIEAMESDLAQKLNVRDLFAVVRAASLPMMKTFAHKGYKYCGTLCNNSQIGSNLPEILKPEDQADQISTEISTMHIFAKSTSAWPLSLERSTPSVSWR